MTGLYSVPCVTVNFKHGMPKQPRVQSSFCITLESDIKSVFSRLFFAFLNSNISSI